MSSSQRLRYIKPNPSWLPWFGSNREELSCLDEPHFGRFEKKNKLIFKSTCRMSRLAQKSRFFEGTVNTAGKVFLAVDPATIIVFLYLKRAETNV